MVAPGAEIRFCPVCGKAFPPGARFCPEDGVLLVDAPRGAPPGTPSPAVAGAAPPTTVVPPTIEVPAPSRSVVPSRAPSAVAPAPAPAPMPVVPRAPVPAPAPAPVAVSRPAPRSDDDLPTHRPSAVPPLSTDVLRAAMSAPAPAPPIFTEGAHDPHRPRKAPAPLVEYVGRTIYSQFVVEELCGVGSTGTVFRARQLGIGRPVALKVLHPDLKSQPEIVARFQREAQIASRISHPNIVHLYLAGLLPDGNLFLAMEFVVGAGLSSVVPPEGMPLERAVHIIGQVLAALGEAHRAGIIHRDLKPENVMLTRVGDDPDYVKVLDFGIARVLDHKTVATRSGLVFGSPKYISPEAAAGDPADARSDIYSCGVLLYEMLAGRPPFDAEKPLDILMKHVREEPPRLSSVRRGPPLPGAVELAVHQAIEKNPERRFRTAEVFAQALRNAAGMGERRLAQSSPKLPPASFILPEKPVEPEKAPATPGAAAHPIASPAHAMMMAR
ncbi:MAG: protein kinase, partial [Deltaproteobacteria bacterium]|nr:protein kinase [Deltaproteobacteria bacterium]